MLVVFVVVVVVVVSVEAGGETGKDPNPKDVNVADGERGLSIQLVADEVGRPPAEGLGIMKPGVQVEEGLSCGAMAESGISGVCFTLGVGSTKEVLDVST